MTLEEARKKIFELDRRCDKELEEYRKELAAKGIEWPVGLDGPKTEIEKKYNRMECEILAEFDPGIWDFYKSRDLI